jgi:hypothetical protein
MDPAEHSEGERRLAAIMPPIWSVYRHQPAERRLAIELLEAQRKLLVPSWQHNGRVVDMITWLSDRVFQRLEAVRCAVEIQSFCKKKIPDIHPRAILIRIGIHLEM